MSLKWCLIFGTASVPLGILVWYFYIPKLRKSREKRFAQMMADFTPLYNRITAGKKRALFEELSAIKPNVPELKGSIRILEIGAGSGSNLDYYPSNCHLSIVEPNELFKDMIKDKLKQFPGIHLDNYYLAHAEDMSEIESEHFDVVVSTLVFCSVSNMQKVLKEVNRVLVPGGKFLYMEHVVDKPGTLLYYKQQLLSRLRIWPWMFDGCYLNRNIDKEVEKGNFAQVLQERFDIETSAFWALPYVKVHVSGVAIKEA